MPKLRVLIVDDAVVVRKILTDALSSDPDLEVFTAANGRIALQKLAQVKPDVVTLDIEMPELDGLATLRELRKTDRKLPVIMFSTLAERGAAMTLDALAAGASDYVTKPANVGSVSIAIARVKAELIPKIKALCGFKPSTPAPAAVPLPPSTTARCKQAIEAVVIGVSTGGPNALSVVLPQLPADLPVPVAVVQHMPPTFTRVLAERLDATSSLDVREGAAGMAVKAGQIVIAPGGLHMEIAGPATRPTIRTHNGPEENYVRPAVDALFRSAVQVWGGRLLAVVLTGMGSDGQRGCQLVRNAGGRVVVQDEATSVVWGMPGAVVRAGVADSVLPLDRVAGEIVRIVQQSRSAGAACAA